MSDGFNSRLGECERARSDISCQKFVYFCKRVRAEGWAAKGWAMSNSEKDC